MNDDLPPSNELDYQAIADLLDEWNDEFMENGDEWHAPGMWWSQRISKLAIRVNTKAQLKRLGIDEYD